ncbi:rho GTPase-activating protein 24 isoform X2 [Hoplias malabaricus]
MTANHETYLLMASTQNDMEDWVKSIRRVIWAPFGGGIFGQKLEETVRYERRYGNKLAPMLVEQCVDFIRQWGLKEEGLFRLPGQANLVKELQDAFDCGEKPSFDSNTDVHTVASLLKLYLRELPEPVIPFCKYEEFLSCTKLLSRDQDTGMKELRRQVESLPLVNYNLLKYICRFLDEVQSFSGVNKMSVQNLATVFGPNILRAKVEDPVAIMEGAILIQQLMAVLIGQYSVVFPQDEGCSPGTVELCYNNNNELHPPSRCSPSGQLQNKENNNPASTLPRCTWDAPDSPGRVMLDNGSPRSASPRNTLSHTHFEPQVEVSRSPPLMVKKNAAVSKGSKGIVTNGSFSSTSPCSAEPGQDRLQNHSPPGPGSSQTRRTKLGVSSTDGVNGAASGRSNGLWSPPGYVTLRETKGKSRECCEQQNRLSTYDNVQQVAPCLSSSSCEDKQSVDSATWSTSSCEISLPENSASCRSSTTTCPEQELYSHPGEGGGERDRASSRGTSSSENSETAFPLSNGATSHSALHSLVASLKQEMMKQKSEYEARIKSLELSNVELEGEVLSLREELEQERKKFNMVEIKLRNAERAKDDAEKRNEMLQKEMEQFFSTFGDLTSDPRRPDRANTIWIQ